MPKSEARYAGFLPGRHPITAYGNGGFRFADMSHCGSLLLLPSGILAISASSIHEIATEDLAHLALEKEEIELILIGTGINFSSILSSPLKQFLSESGIKFEIMQTGAAIRTYNVLLEERRRIAAILIASH